MAARPGRRAAVPRARHARATSPRPRAALRTPAPARRSTTDASRAKRAPKRTAQCAANSARSERPRTPRASGTNPAETAKRARPSRLGTGSEAPRAERATASTRRRGRSRQPRRPARPAAQPRPGDRRWPVVQRRIGAIFATVLPAARAGRLRAPLYLGVAPRRQRCARPPATQQLTDETVTAQRGTITDRNGVDLAVSEPAQDLSADPYLVSDPLAAAQRLAPLLGQTAGQRAAQALAAQRLRVPGARAARTTRPKRSLALKIPGVARHAGDAPRVPARHARRAGARHGRHRRQGAGGPRVLAQRAAARARRASAASSATRSASRSRSPKPHAEQPGHVALADARREHPAAHRRRARRRRAACSTRRTPRRS